MDAFISDDLSLSQLVENSTLIYGQSVMIDKFPDVVDGLKRIHRRILWSLYKERKFVSGTVFTGETMKIHPHGDTSVFNTAVRMSNEFHYRPALMLFGSDSGDYSGNGKNAAAPRYSKARISDFSRDVFFGNIEINAIPKMLTEDRGDVEPVRFIPALPTALLYGNGTIGFGYSGNTVGLGFKNLCDLVVAYVKHQKLNPTQSFDYTVHIDKFIPEFPIINTILNHHELVQAYKTGNFKAKIIIEGEAEVTQDTIRIRTLPYGNSFAPLIEKIYALKKTWDELGISGIDDMSNEKDIANVVIRLNGKSSTNVFKTWRVIKKLISFVGSSTPVLNYTTEDGYLREVYPQHVLSEWYEHRYNILLASKKHQLMKLASDIRIVEAYLIIGDRTDEVIKIIRGNESQDAIAQLCKVFKLTLNQATYLSNAGLISLSKTSKIDFKARHLELSKKLETLKHSFSSIGDEIIEEVLFLKKKYSINRLTKIPNYIGYVAIDDGAIQIEDLSEIEQLLKDFSRTRLKVFLYDGNHHFRVDDSDKLVHAVSKISTGHHYGLKVEPKSIYTVQIKDGSGVVVGGLVPDKDNDGYLYTQKKSKILQRDGVVRSVDITKELSYRKTICSGAMTKVCYVWPDANESSYIAVFCDQTPNIMYIYRVSDTTNRIPLNPTGELMVCHKYGSSNWYINLDRKFLHRNNSSILHITDVEKLLDGKTNIRIELGSSKTKADPNLSLL